jgi:hypothetical protein
VRLTFVVGTGRCGSTMLSAILREHPDVLSLSEFFGTLRTAAQTGARTSAGHGLFPAALDGRDLWRLLADRFGMLDEMVSSGLPVSGYPFGRGRFLPATGIPLICHYVLPMLTADPDALFDALAGQVPAWPRRPAAAQYRAFFRHLAGLFGRSVVVERSAASLGLIGSLHEHFGSARFVHLYRDGADCALSMSRHPVFRRELLAIAAAHEAGLPAATPGELAAALPERYLGLVFPPYDAARLMAYPIPVTAFGRYRWSPMICAGVDALAKLPPDCWLPLRYEDLLRDPAASLTALAQFIGIDAPRPWLATAGEIIDPAKSGTAATQLDPATLAALRAACAPGERALTAATAPSKP